tara:strand:+ start:7640 stop:8578 length:939 start_codon:yes stop_codon:yes gene_type:complete
MAHAVETMAYAGELPWHGLGVKVADDLTPREMQEAAGLDWSVEKLPMVAKAGDEEIRIPTQQALVRSTDKKVLSVIGQNWEPVQNDEAFDFFVDFVKQGNMQMHTAGSLQDGKMVWALAKVDDDFELFNGDKIESYLLFSNPHQYGKSIDVRFSPIRVVCNNTLTMALNGKVGVSLDHRKAFDAQTVQQTLGLAKESMDEYKEVAEFLGSKRYTKDSLNNYFADVFGKSSKSEKDNVILTRNGQRALEVIDTQPGANYQKGTFWQALNAVTYMTDHELANTRDNRVHSAWFGGNRVKKINAVKKAVEYAQAA